MERIMSTRKKKAVVAIIGGALALTISTGAAFATSDGDKSEYSVKKESEIVASKDTSQSADGKGIQEKNENSKMSHSTDDIPLTGDILTVIVNEDGSVSVEQK